jgi:hypothetical protein
MALLTEIIPKQNFEVVRDLIGAILAVEVSNQFALTGKAELNAKVYCERTIPFAYNNLPAINVMFSGGTYDLQTQQKTDGTYKYFIDCYTSAQTEGTLDGDKLALTRLHSLLGICRAILEAPVYKRLGLAAPSIERAFASGIDIAQPENDQDATSTVFGRLTFEVRVPETVELQKAVTLAGFDTAVSINVSSEGYYWTSDDSGDLPPPLCAGVLVLDSDGVSTFSVPSGGVGVCTTFTDVVVTDTDDTTSNVGNGGSFICTKQLDIFLKGLFAASEDTLNAITIDADNAGTYTSITDDGGSGAITLSKNGGAFAAFSSPLVLVIGNTFEVKRATTGAEGHFKISGTYV